MLLLEILWAIVTGLLAGFDISMAIKYILLGEYYFASFFLGAGIVMLWFLFGKRS